MTGTEAGPPVVPVILFQLVYLDTFSIVWRRRDRQGHRRAGREVTPRPTGVRPAWQTCYPRADAETRRAEKDRGRKLGWSLKGGGRDSEGMYSTRSAEAEALERDLVLATVREISITEDGESRLDWDGVVAGASVDRQTQGGQEEEFDARPTQATEQRSRAASRHDKNNRRRRTRGTARLAKWQSETSSSWAAWVADKRGRVGRVEQLKFKFKFKFKFRVGGVCHVESQIQQWSFSSPKHQTAKAWASLAASQQHAGRTGQKRAQRTLLCLISCRGGSERDAMREVREVRSSKFEEAEDTAVPGHDVRGGSGRLLRVGVNVNAGSSPGLALHQPQLIIRVKTLFSSMARVAVLAT